VALAEPIKAVVDMVRTQILRPGAFDPATSAHTFTIVTPDIGEIQFLPALIAVLEREAPGVHLRAVSRTAEHASEALSRGDADLALGYFPDLKGAGFFQQKLFDNPLVCLLREGHPKAANGKLTERDYFAARHVVVRPAGREHVFESHLHRQGEPRNVVLEVAHFMSVLPIIESTDLVATVPHDLARTCERYAKVIVVDSPIPAPSVPVHQFWHRRTHEDAASKWLRAAVVRLFGAGGTGRASSVRR
jgi:DNA-binding transcriptional LysR family regulator